MSESAPLKAGDAAAAPAKSLTGLRGLGGYRAILKSKILGLVPELISRLQVTKRFIDERFAINCRVYREKKDAA